MARSWPAGKSPVEALLADYPLPDSAGAAPPLTSAEPLPSDSAEAGAEPPALDGAPMPAAQTPRPATTLITHAALPPAEDIALGALTVLAESAWHAGSRAVAAAASLSVRAIDVLRAVSPTFATELAEARLTELGQRGRAVRTERAEAVNAVLTDAITNAATSDAMRQMSVAAIEEATDDVLAVVLPAMLEAVTELETQEKLDELMAGLLLRQLPSALEKTLPGVMMRTATKPAAGLMPFLSGVLPKG